MLSVERQENLIIVAALEGYADMRNIPVSVAYELFVKYNLFNMLRKHYGTLHTQDLYEGAHFADDYIKRLQS
jgi:hypothetical protein